MLKIVLLILFYVKNVRVLNNGLALTPPMGWMSWGYYMCTDDCVKKPHKCISEKLILSVADEFYINGYQEAGYEYIIIDDCWSERQRDSEGRLVPDKKRFPNGMKYIADYIHSRGLKFGMYGSAGPTTCMQYPGSQGHLKIDAETFAEWDVDYVKFDGCYVTEEYLNHVYIDFGNYLNKTGRPMVYSCSWPYYIEFVHKHTPNYDPIMKTCNLWRNYHDVFFFWDSVYLILKYYESQAAKLASYMAPGHWNDPDMIVVGAGVLTEGQCRIQMSMYAMLSAPLIFSFDMKNVSKAEKDILLNMDLIAIAQDKLAFPAIPYKINEDTTLWVKKHLPLKGDLFYSFSFLFVNFGQSVSRVSVVPGRYGLYSTSGYTVLDIFKNKYILNITLEDSLHAEVPKEDVIFYTLYAL